MLTLYSVQKADMTFPSFSIQTVGFAINWMSRDALDFKNICDWLTFWVTAVIAFHKLKEGYSIFQQSIHLSCMQKVARGQVYFYFFVQTCPSEEI